MFYQLLEARIVSRGFFNILDVASRKFRNTENGNLQVSMKISNSLYDSGPYSLSADSEIILFCTQKVLAVSQRPQQDHTLNAFNSVQSLQSDPKSLIPITLTHFRMARTFLVYFFVYLKTYYQLRILYNVKRRRDYE
jgi:hypothetical protein